MFKNIRDATGMHKSRSDLNHLEKYHKSASKLANWIESAIPQGKTVYQITSLLWRKLRTINTIEGQNKVILRRTRVATLFPNTEYLVRLVSENIMEISEDLETGRKYGDLSYI